MLFETLVAFMESSRGLLAFYSVLDFLEVIFKTGLPMGIFSFQGESFVTHVFVEILFVGQKVLLLWCFFLVFTGWFSLSPFLVHCSPTLYWRLVLITLGFNTFRSFLPLLFFLNAPLPRQVENYRQSEWAQNYHLRSYPITGSSFLCVAFCKQLNLCSFSLVQKWDVSISNSPTLYVVKGKDILSLFTCWCNGVNISILRTYLLVKTQIHQGF